MKGIMYFENANTRKFDISDRAQLRRLLRHKAATLHKKIHIFHTQKNIT